MRQSDDLRQARELVTPDPLIPAANLSRGEAHRVQRAPYGAGEDFC